jgi:hypothetical protein
MGDEAGLMWRCKQRCPWPLYQGGGGFETVLESFKEGASLLERNEHRDPHVSCYIYPPNNDQLQPTNKRAILVLPLEGASGEEAQAENEARLIQRQLAPSGNLGPRSEVVDAATWLSWSPTQQRRLRWRWHRGTSGSLRVTTGARASHRPSPLTVIPSITSIDYDRDMSSTPTLKAHYCEVAPLVDLRVGALA